MAMDFPSNPIDGQISGNYIYSASSGVWKSKPIAGTTTIHSSVMPLSANPGDVWFNTNDGTSFTYFDDGTSKQWVEMISSGVPNVSVIMPTGSIIQTALPSAPTGWLFCQGQAISRTTYSVLFNALSTTYGAGDGSTTFNLPNLQGKIPVGKNSSGTFATLGATGGAETVALAEANVPSHTHTFSATTSTNGDHAHNYTTNQSNATFSTGGGTGMDRPSQLVNNGTTTTNGAHNHTVSGTTGTGSGSATAHNNLQPYIVLNYMIKT